MNNIRYHIDSVNKEEGHLVIVGWAYAPNKPKVAIKVDGCSDYKIEKIERIDIFNKFGEEDDALDSGFKIILPYKNKVNIVLTCGKEIVTEKVSVLRYNRNKNRGKGIIGKIYTIINLLRPYNIIKAISYIRTYGIRETFYKIKGKLRMTNLSKGIGYDEWYRKNKISDEELASQKKHKFSYEPKISIVVPTYNTDSQFLIEMIESVINQSYDNWELCIADGASTNKQVRDILEDYSKRYKKIKVKFLEENLMISGNTNEAMKLVTGEYIGLFDHDDLLTPDALFEVVQCLNENKNCDFVYSDEDKIDEKNSEYFDPHFKPDWSPDLMRSYNYITHFTVFSKDLYKAIGDFNSEYDGSQDYDMFLRLTEQAKCIKHIPKILYHWRVHKNSTASGIGAKSYALEASRKALESHLKRIGEDGIVKDGKYIGSFKVDYKIEGKPLVSIIIPNKDEVSTLKKCITSIIRKTTYENYEILIVENNSTEEKTFKYYDDLINKYNNVRVIKWDSGFNYSAINNFAVKQARGEYVILLNNDVEIITKKWIEEMLMHAQRKDVGIVGAKLYYPDETIQHAGVIMGIGSVAGHSHKYFHRDEMGHAGRLKVVQNLSGVTAACLMVSKSIYNEVNGLDEGYRVAFNDVDFCMKVREKGYLVIFTPYTELYHYESKSRGAENTPEKIERFNNEIKRFEQKWGLWMKDPYYNSNLTLIREDFSLKEDDEKSY